MLSAFAIRISSVVCGGAGVSSLGIAAMCITTSVRARMPAFGLIGIRMVIIGVWLQTWMRVIVGVDVL